MNDVARQGEPAQERSGPSRCGDYYRCAKVGKDVSPNGEIYVFADRVAIEPGGALIFIRAAADKRPEYPNPILAASKWSAVHAASCPDGSAVAFKRWEDEVARILSWTQSGKCRGNWRLPKGQE